MSDAVVVSSAVGATRSMRVRDVKKIASRKVMKMAEMAEAYGWLGSLARDKCPDDRDRE